MSTVVENFVLDDNGNKTGSGFMQTEATEQAAQLARATAAHRNAIITEENLTPSQRQARDANLQQERDKVLRKQQLEQQKQEQFLQDNLALYINLRDIVITETTHTPLQAKYVKQLQALTAQYAKELAV